MQLTFDERCSDSPLVERIWQTRSEQAGDFISLAASQWEMVVTRYQGETTITMRGPESQATPAHCPPDAEFFGIVFKVGTFMPHLPLHQYVDGGVHLPIGGFQSFRLHGSSLELPTYDNADTFVERLVRDELLIQDPIVTATLRGQRTDLSLRSIQRRFLQVTGLTHTTIYQIQRARYATQLLQDGLPILDVVDKAGYADQPHLTRALRRYVGQTPAQLMPHRRLEPMSFIFETMPYY